MKSWLKNRRPSGAVLVVLLTVIPASLMLFWGAKNHLEWLLQGAGASALYTVGTLLLFAAWGNKYTSLVLGVPLLLFMMAVQVLRVVSFRIQGQPFNESFFFHFSLDVLTQVGAAFLPLIVAGILASLVVGFWLYRVLSLERQLGSRWVVLGFGLSLVGVVADPDVRRGMDYWLQQKDLRALALKADKRLADPRLVELGLQTKHLSTPYAPDLNDLRPKNLVFIYLESLEQAFFDERLFPGLMPNLNALRAEGRNYVRVDQTQGAGFTIAGVVASQCGTPLLPIGQSAHINGNDWLSGGFLSRATCLGDILSANGYHQVFMGGASVEFAGKGPFLKAHGYNEAWGKADLGKRVSDEAIEGWGLYDDALFALAAATFKQLSAQQQPFNLSVLTLDTHLPARPSPSCRRYQNRDDADLHAAHCTDQIVGGFIRQLKATDAWSDTVVVIFSDHLAFPAVTDHLLPRNYARQLTFTVINGGTVGEVETPGTHMDVAPTVLSHLQISVAEDFFLAGKNLDLLGQRSRVWQGSTSLERLNWLRVINSSVLSDDHNFCRNRPQVEARLDALQVSGHKVTLRHQGWALQSGEFGQKYAYVAQLAKDASVLQQGTVTHEQLEAYVAEYQASQLGQEQAPLLLVVTRSEHLPAQIRAQLGAADGRMSIVLLDPNAKVLIHSVASSQNLNQAFLDMDNCPSVLAQPRDVTHVCLSEQSALLPVATRGASGEVESIRIPLVYVGENLTYRAELKRNPLGQWVVHRPEQLAQSPTGSKLAKLRCGATFTGKDLLMPLILDGDHQLRARLPLMEQSSDGTSFVFAHRPLQALP